MAGVGGLMIGAFGLVEISCDSVGNTIRSRLDVTMRECYNPHNTIKGNTMITIENATVETPDGTQARPYGKTWLSVTIGDYTFDLPVDEDELNAALASQQKAHDYV